MTFQNTCGLLKFWQQQQLSQVPKIMQYKNHGLLLTDTPEDTAFRVNGRAEKACIPSKPKSSEGKTGKD